MDIRLFHQIAQQSSETRKTYAFSSPTRPKITGDRRDAGLEPESPPEIRVQSARKQVTRRAERETSFLHSSPAPSRLSARMSSYSVNSSGYGSNGYPQHSQSYGYRGSQQEMAEYSRNGHQGRRTKCYLWSSCSLNTSFPPFSQRLALVYLNQCCVDPCNHLFFR